MARWLAWLGVGLFVAGIVLGILVFGTTTVCPYGRPGSNYSILDVAYELPAIAVNAVSTGNPCSVTVVLGTAFFLGGPLLIWVSDKVRRETPPPSS